MSDAMKWTMVHCHKFHKIKHRTKLHWFCIHFPHISLFAWNTNMVYYSMLLHMHVNFFSRLLYDELCPFYLLCLVLSTNIGLHLLVFVCFIFFTGSHQFLKN